ncbi:MFS transporter [Pseudomonas helleri]|uniref:YbfB/YjiJ family MFS transporter n=1 Tax=Pseudomonas helleri TaxID=1608996 RepID=A0A6A7YWA4_9PSED|nr:MFS transporter [Pseudomonas helleri]MQT81302.1 YbfB/YjiJ family MFS transporter [Pseudomonas helleri]MQU18481.1 YbfB/YjiJ family MFS transporter [Pseudomonas helleri]MQU28958.1 YbfB/YjiJ family MFS transporter [Pseudomonas helleri]
MSPLTRLIASFIALVMAMGIGRFSLTPQLPHLISEGQIDLTGAGLIAAANYLGYLVGALDAMRAKRPEQVQARLHIGLWLCVGLTLVSFWAHGFWPHLLLRFGAGIASAWVMVMIASLSQQLAVSANRPRLGALVFAGPGVGVLLTGLLALVSNLYGQSSATLWLIYAAAALIMVLGISPLLPKPAALPVQAPIAPRAARQPGISRLGAIYGLYGLGYIIPATFLSQMASAQFHGQWQADLFWPAFGLCAAIGVVLISVRRPDPDTTRWWLMGALWVQALGVLACLLPSGAGLALGVILCGTPFLACMPLVMQSSRDLAPHATQRNAALLTACFAVGQLCGPLLAALSSHFSGGLHPALMVAASGLVLAGLLAVQKVSAPVALAPCDGSTARH